MFCERNGLGQIDIRETMEENPIETFFYLGAKGDSSLWLKAHKVVILQDRDDEDVHRITAFSTSVDEEGRREVILDLHVVGLKMGEVRLGSSYYYAYLKPISHQYSLSGIKIPGVNLEELYPKIAGQRIEISIRFP